jgi:acyl-CoA thioester hydrolase
MNVGYYGVVFDYSTDAFLTFVGLDPAHRAQQGITTFTLEAHFTYQREVVEGDALRFTTQLLAFDEKRIHYFHRMHREADGGLSATNELMSLHVSESTRRAAPMHEAVLARLEQVAASHAELPLPAEVGRVMGLEAGATTG